MTIHNSYVDIAASPCRSPSFSLSLCTPIWNLVSFGTLTRFESYLQLQLQLELSVSLDLLSPWLAACLPAACAAHLSSVGAGGGCEDGIGGQPQNNQRANEAESGAAVAAIEIRHPGPVHISHYTVAHTVPSPLFPLPLPYPPLPNCQSRLHARLPNCKVKN